ncbi:DUF3267 domain-containing protein [Prolixibacteraceae bacterium JC049]|nr:DUF3267 domain-containing protein [Prolixibacteraceae bacterium JC049]
MNIQPNELENSGYVLIDKLKHNDLMVFLTEKNKTNKSFYSYLFLGCLIAPLPILSFFFTISFLQDKITIGSGLLYCLLGIGLVFLFIPFHELLHALGYRLVGARNISFFANIKKLYFAAISDKSVINLKEFKVVALFPFLFVIITGLALIPLISNNLLLTIITFITVHNLFCSGDFALLNYMQSNKHKGIVTYDDKAKGETYFYIQN